MVNAKRLAAVVSISLAACTGILVSCGGDDAATDLTGGSAGVGGGGASMAGASGSGGTRAGSAGSAGRAGNGGAAGNAAGGAAGSGASDASMDGTSGSAGTGGGSPSDASVDAPTDVPTADGSGADGASTDVVDAGASADGPSSDVVNTDVAISPESGTGSDGATCLLGGPCTFGDGGTRNGVYDASCVCQSCASDDTSGDTQCQSGYGPGYLCTTGANGLDCILGDCRSTSTTAPTCSGGKICNNHACAPCGTTPDCTSAYGAGYVCAAGSCIQGDCVTSADCNADGSGKAGDVCGANNNCGQCTSDDQCAADPYYTNAGLTLCNTSTHVCVAATCSGVGPSSCAGNHVCCGSVCQPDTTFSTTNGPGKSCCGNTDCNGTGASSCTQSVCSVCPIVQENQATHTYDFIVDPSDVPADAAAPSEVGASGADQAGCRFRTLTAAL